MSEIHEVVGKWQGYFDTVEDWEKLVEGVEPKIGGCGLVYELPSPFADRPNEGLAIADMRNLEIAEPHAHTNGEVEIYFVLKGVGKTAVGSAMYDLSPGVSVVTPTDTVHCTLPGEGLVLAVVNTPPFNIDNYVPVSAEDEAVAKMIMRLRSEAT